MSEERKIVTYLESDLPKLIMCGRASSRTGFSLRLDGPVTAKELKAVVRMIEAQIQLLEEDQVPSPDMPEPRNG